MDSTGNERWAAKIGQHRRQRQKLYDKNRRADVVFEEVADQFGSLIHDWIGIFQDAFRRECPASPSDSCNFAKNEINGFIDSEHAIIAKELPRTWTEDLIANPTYSKHIEDGKSHLASTCEVLKTKCFEAAENARAQRQAELDREGADRNRVWKELAVGGLIAIFSSFVTLFWADKSRRAELEPFVAVSFGEGNSLGQARVQNDTLRVSIINSGPSDVADIELFLGVFSARIGSNLELQEPSLELFQPRPLLLLGGLRAGQKLDRTIGKDDGYSWENFFKSDSRPGKNRTRFCRVQLRYRHMLSGRHFYTTRLYYASRETLAPASFPLRPDDVWVGYDR